MKTRVVNFPPDRSLGEVYLRSGDSPAEWAEFAEARGDVPVPADAELRLKVVNMARPDFNLAPLATLAPNEIQVLDLACTHVGDDDLRFIEHLVGLRGLALWETDIGDPALRYIGNLVGLRWLDLGDTKITDNGLSYLTPLVSLKQLLLLNTRLSDQGLVYLVELSNLDHLDLMGTRITDAGVGTLKKLQSLRSLRIYDTNVSELGYLEIKKALPQCAVKFKSPHHT